MQNNHNFRKAKKCDGREKFVNQNSIIPLSYNLCSVPHHPLVPTFQKKIALHDLDNFNQDIDN